jgi:hypothetical protein
MNKNFKEEKKSWETSMTTLLKTLKNTYAIFETN